MEKKFLPASSWFAYPWIESLDWGRQKREMNNWWSRRLWEGGLWYCSSQRIRRLSILFFFCVPLKFSIVQFFYFLHHVGNTVWECSSDWLYYVYNDEYWTWHNAPCQVLFISVCFVPVVGWWMGLGLAGLAPKVRLHFAPSSSLPWLCSLYTEFEAPNLIKKEFKGRETFSLDTWRFLAPRGSWDSLFCWVVVLEANSDNIDIDNIRLSIAWV